MASKPILFRPIEIVTGVNDVVKFTPNGEGEITETLPPGTYSSLLAVLYELQLRCAGGNNNCSIQLNKTGGTPDDAVVQFGFNIKDNAINFNNAATARMFGANAITQAEDTAITLSYRPEYIWIPAYQVANQGRFQARQRDLFKGVMAKTGVVGGTVTGPNIYFRRLEFQNEFATNLMDDGVTSEDYRHGGGTTKHLDYFVQQCLASSPSVTTNPSTKGFHFYPDWDNIMSYGITEYSMSALMTALFIPGGQDGTTNTLNGVKFDLADTTNDEPDAYVFCQFPPEGYTPPAPVEPNTGRTYYNTQFEIHTVETFPSWENVTDLP